MKKIFLFVIVGMFSFASQAQDGMRLGVNAGLPIGDLADGYSFSVHGDLGFLWGVSDDFSAGIITGVAHYFGEDAEVAGFEFEVPDATFIPVAGSARFNLSDQFRLGADLGYAIGISEDVDGGLYYAPRVHYSLSENMDLSLSYRGISNDGVSGDAIVIGLEFGI